eukprot:UN02730
MSQLEPAVLEKIREVNAKPYKAQAIWFLNAFFHELKDDQKKNVYDLVAAFSKEDHVKGAKGNELNAVQAFSLLQKRNQTLTALQLKAQLRTVDIDANGEMALAEYLLFHYEKSPKDFATRPQGTASEEEQRKLDDVKQKVDLLSKVFEELSAAQAAAEKAEEEVKAAKAEAEEVAAEIKKQEDAKAAEIARLEALTQDQSVGIVKRNMAVQQLAAAKNEDPLPLRKAKLTQDACVRRLDRAVKASEAATQAATEKANQAAAELKAAEEEFKQLQATCSGIAHGEIYYLEQELIEKKRYLPQRLQ